MVFRSIDEIVRSARCANARKPSHAGQLPMASNLPHYGADTLGRDDGHRDAAGADVFRRRDDPQQPAPAVPDLSQRHRSLRHARPRRRDRADIHPAWLGRHVAQRHLPLRALSFDDPRGARRGARPRPRAVRRPAGRGDRARARRRRRAARRHRPSVPVGGARADGDRRLSEERQIRSLPRQQGGARPAVETIADVPLPATDPVYGADGPLKSLWR